MPEPVRVAVIGGGVAGLMAAQELLARGCRVDLYERDAVFGGLASSFALDNGYLERFYHFICLGDSEYLNTLRELGLARRLRWRLTGMGQFYEGKLYSLGYPWDILLFSPLPPLDRIRFAAAVMGIKSRPFEGWREIENVPVEEWVIRHFGRRMYDILYRPLLSLKFGARVGNLSAAWLWARIHRLGKSRTRLLQLEKLGYVHGGSQVIVDALVDRIRSAGGGLYAGRQIDRIRIEAGRVNGVESAGETVPCDAVLSTVPTPFLAGMLPDAPSDFLRRLREIDSIGVSCLILRLDRPFTKFFWTNVSDHRIPLAGLIEYTNLNAEVCPNGDSLLYAPQYLPPDSARYRQANDEVYEEYLGYLKMIRPDFDRAWVRSWWIFRERYAQPICSTGFTSQVIGIETPVEGLYITDSHQLHPDDRTISNSLGLGRRAAHIIATKLAAPPR